MVNDQDEAQKCETLASETAMKAKWITKHLLEPAQNQFIKVSKQFIQNKFILPSLKTV